MGTFVWGCSRGNVRLGTPAWKLPLGNLLCEFSFGNFRLDVASLEPFSLGVVAWNISCGRLRLETFARERSFGNSPLVLCVLGSVVSELSLGKVCLGTFVWRLSLDSLAWELVFCFLKL